MSFAHPTPSQYPATYADLSAGTLTLEEQNASETSKKVSRLRRIGIATSNYIKTIATDYATVLKDICKDSRSRPLKAASYGGLLAGVIYSYKSNPDIRQLRSKVVDLRQDMTLLPAPIHNKKADAHLERLTSLLNNNRLDHYNCFLFSVLLQRPYDRKCNIYEAQDKTTRNWWWQEIWNNLVDIGAFNRFWYLEHTFKDYDVNEDEFQLNSVSSDEVKL
ncbi:translocase of the inner mitochondrial membrane 29 domain-containing protein [Ditylenchus destructor]|uniref:Translocase of the inner mitochondrial membrane 29 domain-containing protein n=1 Tax=Ditylenchus destructor TaxID=166010 RepID=A0AAD4ND90_9BILA|nr:translocase of the inner mitochondrial membrane 29 domain-containing protein [Ditylenchus destructor]